MSRSIYVVRSEIGPVKIGIASSIRSRFSGLNTASPVDLFMDYAAHSENGDVRAIERRAHEILDAYRARGEWFNVDSATAIKAVLQAASDLGFSLREREDGDSVENTPITMRMSTEVMAAIDEFRHSLSVVPSRQASIASIVEEWLRAKGYLK